MYLPHFGYIIALTNVKIQEAIARFQTLRNNEDCTFSNTLAKSNPKMVKIYGQFPVKESQLTLARQPLITGDDLLRKGGVVVLIDQFKVIGEILQRLFILAEHFVGHAP